jgi:hypothetical protein
MAIDKGKLVEKMKGMNEEEKSLFLEAIKEAFPDKPPDDSEILSGEEIKSIREILSSVKPKGKKEKSILNTLFGGLE